MSDGEDDRRARRTEAAAGQAAAAPARRAVPQRLENPPEWWNPAMPEPSRVVRALLDDEQLVRWNLGAPLGTPVGVTFSFLEAPVMQVETPDRESIPMPGFRAFTEGERAAARAALDAWAAASGLSFVEVPDSAGGGDIRFAAHDFSGTVQQGNAGYTDVSYPTVEERTQLGGGHGDVYVNTATISDGGYFAPGGYGYLVLLHEIGHALGLDHSFEGQVRLESGEDNTSNTIMSYTHVVYYPATLGPYDVEAIRYLYGADDGGLSVRWDDATATLVAGNGAAAGWIFGSDHPDRLRGGAGADTLAGLAGTDTLTGGAGDDVLDGGPDADLAVYSQARGRYRLSERADGRLQLSGPDGRDILANVERARFGTGAPVVLLEAGVDWRPELRQPLPERSAAEGQAFRYPLAAGSFADRGGDRLTLSARQGDGTDLPGWLRFEAASGTFFGTVPAGAPDVTVRVSARDPGGLAVSDEFHLDTPATAAGSGPEPPALSATAGATARQGGTGDDLLRGGAGADLLDGGLGADSLAGGGGDDVLYGGSSDDTLYGGPGRDYLVGGTGADRLFDSSFGPGGVLLISAEVDWLYGGDGDDGLRSWGGADLLDGGDGNDTLYSDGGNATIIGGRGEDEFTLAGHRADFRWSGSPGLFQVEPVAPEGAGWTLTVREVERVGFFDRASFTREGPFPVSELLSAGGSGPAALAATLARHRAAAPLGAGAAAGAAPAVPVPIGDRPLDPAALAAPG